MSRSYGKFPNIKFLSRATVVILSSTVDEVFPLTVVEAFAFGKPVIASNVGGLPELVRHGETGWLTEPGNVQALSKQLQSVSEINPLLLMKMSKNCKEYAYKFTTEKNINGVSRTLSSFHTMNCITNESLKPG